MKLVEPDEVPDDWRPTVADGPINLVVDGELFQVTIASDGGSRYTWISGPNPGYGFQSGAPSVAWRTGNRLPTAPLPIPLPTVRYHRTCISGFLAEIDPETGYMSEAPFDDP